MLCDRYEVVFQISNVWPALEVRSVAIGEDTRIDHMDFADPPAVKALFSKEMVEHGVAPDLDIARPCADSPQAMRLWDRAKIA